MARFMLYAAAFAALLSGCKPGGGGSTVKIGEQIWMTQNLKVTTFRNGDPIPEAKTFEEWNKALKEEKPAFCYVHFDAKEGEVLYNTFAITDPRNLAPEGWHIPTEDEWQALKAGVFQAHPEEPIGTQLKAKGAWEELGGIPGTNRSKFNAYPMPQILGDVNAFSDIYWKGLAYAQWWCADGGGSVNLRFDEADFFVGGGQPLDHGQSVRCVKD